MAFYKGKGLLKHGDYNGAIHAFERAAELNPAYTAPSNAAIAKIYDEIGEKDHALQLMYKALETAKFDPGVLSVLDVEIGKKHPIFKGLA